MIDRHGLLNIYDLSILQDGLIESVILSFTDITTTQCISQIVAKQKVVIQSLNNTYFIQYIVI